MKANKITVTIEMEMLHIDCVSALVADALAQIREYEKHNGELIAEDGDTVKWKTKSEEVDI